MTQGNMNQPQTECHELPQQAEFFSVGAAAQTESARMAMTTLEAQLLFAPNRVSPSDY